VLQQLARSIGVRESQRNGPHAVDVVIEDVIQLAAEFVDAVGVGWLCDVFLVDWKVSRLAI
jgi:hypothetical protein